MVAVTNYYKLSGLNNANYFSHSSGGRSLKSVYLVKVKMSWLLLEGLGRVCFLAFSSF